MASIRDSFVRLPDWSDMRVWRRTFSVLNASMLLAVLAKTQDLDYFWDGLLALVVYVEPIALITLAALRSLRGRISRTSELAATLLIPTGLTALWASIDQHFLAFDFTVWRAMLWAGITVALLLLLLDLHQRAQSPIIAEARLMALTSRIRPHFLFNSLNAVLGIIRTDPRRAEAAIEELAELIRVLMRENNDLTPLSIEIALAVQYLELEKLRLGERLRVDWDLATCPPNAMVPPLMLQPILENAVYHGIEPLPGGGEVKVFIALDHDQVYFVVSNPHAREHQHRSGNKMALNNIRERLTLFFDTRGRLDAGRQGDQYVVRMTLPYIKGDPQ